MALQMETVARLGDNRELFRLHHKATIIRGIISDMVQDNNGGPLKAIKNYVVKWKL